MFAEKLIRAKFIQLQSHHHCQTTELTYIMKRVELEKGKFDRVSKYGKMHILYDDALTKN